MSEKSSYPASLAVAIGLLDADGCSTPIEPLGGFTIGDADGYVVEHRPAQTGGLAMPISMSRRARLPAASQAWTASR